MVVILSNYLKTYYPLSKADLYSVFIERCSNMTCKSGMTAMITQQSWMFQGSFEDLRKKMRDITFISMIHLGARAFEEISGEVVQTVAFVFIKKKINDFKGTYCRLVEPKSQDAKEKMFLEKKNRYYVSQRNFLDIPGEPIAYWASNTTLEIFKQCKQVQDVAKPRKGLASMDNNRFFRLWQEVDRTKIGIGFESREEAKDSKKKWFPLSKGGSYRKWYGNRDYLINWFNDGKEIKDHIVHVYHGGSYTKEIRSEELYFKPLICWSGVASGSTGFRLNDKGFIFDTSGPAAYSNDEYYIIALLNSKCADSLLKILSPSLSYLSGDIAKIPVVDTDEETKDRIRELSKTCIGISKEDYDCFESSWDFEKHPLVRNCSKIEDAFQEWDKECQQRFNSLKENEEKINKLFIDLYGLQEEISSNLQDEDVTVNLADRKREVVSFISYFVGCAFGRYSLDKKGLVFAGGKWNTADYESFVPDEDGVIPICDDEYFDDDLVGRFIEFVKVIYGADNLEENLKFIADSLGNGETSREVIREYFLNKFYQDHCSQYSVTSSGKRPIYWLFDSGKKNGFKCLVYMHRYHPDTIARIRTDYVHEQQSRYRTAIEETERRILSASGAELVKLKKKLNKLKNQDEELHTYEEKIHHLADQMISIDLDDGVKHNYEIFKDVLAKIK